MPLHIGDRTDGRTDVRSRDYYVTTKIAWLDRLPNFLSNGAPLTRLRPGSAKKLLLQASMCLFCPKISESFRRKLKNAPRILQTLPDQTIPETIKTFVMASERAE